MVCRSCYIYSVFLSLLTTSLPHLLCVLFLIMNILFYCFFMYMLECYCCRSSCSNCPSGFSPTPYAYPSFCNINVLYSPCYFLYFDNACISRGVDVFFFVVIHKSNCESEFRPAAHTVPSAVNTAVWEFAAAFAAHLLLYHLRWLLNLLFTVDFHLHILHSHFLPPMTIQFHLFFQYMHCV